MMQSALTVTVLLVAFVASAQGIKCWQGTKGSTTSNDNKNITNPFDCGTTIKSCKSVMTTFYAGTQGYMTRYDCGESSVGVRDSCDTVKNDQNNPNYYTKTCYCSMDNCNGAGAMEASLALLLALMVTTMFRP